MPFIFMIGCSSATKSICGQPTIVPAPVNTIVEPVRVQEKVVVKKELVFPQQSDLLPWPDEPVKNLDKLTAGIDDGSQKLAIIIQANKITIQNLEDALTKSGRFEKAPWNQQN